MTFQREDRYIVIKRSDLKKVPVAYRRHLVDPMFSLLGHLPRRECVVVESDWPEYHLVWAMLEHRMAGKQVPDFNLWRRADELQQRLAEAEKDTFQARVLPWMKACFGEHISADKQERNHRFLEEALELIQACGATAEEAHQLVDYVYGRAVGEPSQEVGGVMVTLAALCLAQDMDMHAAAETELTRIWGKVEQIRAKQAAKPALGPLPGSYPERVPGPSVSDQGQSS